YMPRVRQLVFEGKYREAQDMVGRQLISNTNQCMSYQPVGDLNLTFPGHERFTDYRRELNISDAVATTRYTVDGVTYKREVFASFAHDVTVVRLTASKKGALAFTANLTSPLKTQTAAEDGALVMRGASGGKDNLPGGKLKFTTVLRAEADGEVTCTGGEMRVSGATAVTLYVSIGTIFVNYRDISGDADKKALAPLDKMQRGKYAKLLKAHSETYQRYFNRVSLDLGTTPAMNLPTDKRVEQFATGDDPQLVSLYFQFGRYLLISCSQPGGQAANLQGIWNEHVTPPWGSKYTTNINAEMNYWPAEVTHLAEMHEPFLRMVREVAQSGAETAREMYGARGWCLHHNTDIWRATAPVDGPWGMWPGGGAWFCQHLWWHYLYGGDKDFLASVYPVMKGAAEFFLDIMVPEKKHGWLVVPVSTSPENAYKGIHVADGITMDNQMVYELFSNVIQATEVLGTDKAFAEEVSVARAQMAPMQIGRHGQLQEWKEDWDRTDDHHRHVSHLWGLFPGQLISPFRTPEIFEGVRNSLNFRGDPATGWSMGWKVCLWARLLDGDRAYKLITEQLRPSRGGSGGTYPNLFDAHPPFQIDGNFGCAAGIAEMLMQSQSGYIELLPSVPAEWQSGEFTGLVARGNITVDCRWEQGKITKVTVTARRDAELRIKLPESLIPSGKATENGIYTAPLKKGESITFQ
ncbi:MAG: glycoside hydrolase family 95 protein, partial [Oscillospiraceae bacterium]|nr:glycoside hydrolase family 95 protein [Oscillospiraceae bacterium]